MTWARMPFKKIPIVMKHHPLNSGKKHKGKATSLQCIISFIENIVTLARRANHSNKSPRAEEAPFSTSAAKCCAPGLASGNTQPGQGRSVHQGKALTPCEHAVCARLCTPMPERRLESHLSWVPQVKPLVLAFDVPTGLTFLCGKCNYEKAPQQPLFRMLR